MVKAVIDSRLEETNVQKGTALEFEQWVKLFNTYDQKEGMRAFIEKRKPSYENK